MPAKTNRVMWKAEDRLMAMTASHLCGGKLSTGDTCWIPALLTRISTGPSASLACGDHARDLFRIGHVGAVVCHVDIILQGELAANPLNLLGVAEAVQQHCGTILGKRSRYA
jgi:hypothetical protein